MSGSDAPVVPPPITPREISRLAAQLFARAPKRYAVMQKYRPYICPFGQLCSYVPNDATVLDIGCGCGLFLGLLAHWNRIQSGVGLDASPEAVAVARQISSDARPGSLRFEVGAKIADWPAGRFSVVSLIDVLHHIPPPGQKPFFQDAAERVEPGGILLFKDMVSRPFWLAWANRLHDLVLARQWIHYVPVDTVEGWAAEKGLKLQARSRMVMLWYGHELRVFERPLPDSNRAASANEPALP